MYNFNEQLVLLEDLGVVGIRVLRVSNERPGPGEKITSGTELAAQNSQGFIGAFNSRQKVTFALVVEVERHDDLHVVWMEGFVKEIRMLGDQTLGSPTATFAKRIPTDTTMSGDYVTKSNDRQGNGIWIVNTANGKLQMWEVAIVTVVAKGQSKYYLSLQKVYAADMYAPADGRGAPLDLFIPEEQFPGYKEWASLQYFLNGVGNFLSYKRFPEYQPEPAKEPVALADNRAEIIWFNQAKGFGFVRINGETPNPNFHRSQVRDQEFPAFQPGQIIRYDSLNRTPRGVQLMGVTES